VPAALRGGVVGKLLRTPLGGDACRDIAEVFDGGVDIVAAFRVGYGVVV